MLEKYKNILKDKREVYLRAKVFPGSNKTEIKEIKTDNIDGKDVETFIFKIKSPAEKNKANQELLKFLAKSFVVLENNKVKHSIMTFERMMEVDKILQNAIDNLKEAKYSIIKCGLKKESDYNVE